MNVNDDPRRLAYCLMAGDFDTYTVDEDGELIPFTSPFIPTIYE